jgi:hypothetical protein
MEIFNVYGEKIFSLQPENNNRKQVTIHLNAAPGIYFLRLKAENGKTVSRKIILQ